MYSTGFRSTRLLGALIIATSAAADNPDPIPEKSTQLTRLDHVVVTASRYQETVESVPANVTIIDQQQIANSTAIDIPEILAKEVGLHVYDITGNGRSYRVDRSGFGETAALNTLVLVDGRRLNSPDLSGADWQLIPLDRVARIEVVRGSRGSVLYGDNATDSVINIITKRGSNELKYGLELAGGSYNTVNPSAYVSGQQDELSYSLSARYYNSDGYRDNSDTEQRDLGLNMDYFFSDTASVALNAGYHKDETGLPGALRLSDLQAGFDRQDTTNPLDFSDTRDYYLDLNPQFEFLSDSYFKAPLSYRRRDQDYFASFVGGEFRGETGTDYITVSPQFVLGEPVGGLDNTLTLGLDYYYADQDITNESSFFGMVDIGRFGLEKKNYGLYIHNELYATDRLALSGGFRHDKVTYRFDPTQPATPDKAEYDQNLFNAGANFRFLDKSYFYLSYAEGFRYPVLDEIFSYFTNTINTDLRPQTSDNFEIGIRHAFSKALYVNINLFRLDTKQEIFFNPVTFSNENLDHETRRDGIELTAGYDKGPFGISGTYTYRDTEIRGGAFDGNQIPNVPRNQASVDLTWRPLHGLSLAVNGIYVGERYLESDFANAFPKQDSYRVFNAKVKYRWQKYTAFLDINNLFDEEYSSYGVLSTFPVEPAFYPAPELNFFAGIRLDY